MLRKGDRKSLGRRKSRKKLFFPMNEALSVKKPNARKPITFGM